MSTVIEKWNNPVRPGSVSSIVKTVNGRYYYVDTSWTFDHGPETMVFEYDIRHKNVKNWSELYCRLYDNMDDAYKTHFQIITDLENYISG